MIFTKFLKPFLLIGGLVTMYAAIYAFDPAAALKDMNGLDFDSQYVFIIRHWGIMVGLMGFFIAASAFKPEWRQSIVLYSFLEKLFMVYLYFSNFLNPETAYLNEVFVPFAITDVTICVYTLGYWFEQSRMNKHHAKA
ncbi:hypothetical protein RGQ13_00420 [Thalassotalea psychrophila]|uniref:Uncharacterized protein n=1 Tax=Thalassotalea psychrophila TaxID=3065647 RepID=A0ABY9TVF0_9GAMM|nr:hypothetical protein RGQ13_00420 [Colwelliaceae bacterium SQ149]